MEPTQQSKKSLWIAVGVIIIIIIFVGYVLSRGGDKNSSLGEKMTFHNLLAMSGAHKCTFTSGSDLSQPSGVFYVADGKGRGDFESSVTLGTEGDTKMGTHMIIVDGVSYVWSDNTKQGMKINLADMNATVEKSPSANPAQEQINQFNQEYDYSCSRWSANEALFTLPKDITFMDMSEMMAGMMGAPSVSGDASASMGQMQNMKEAQCKACEQAGSAKEQCLQTLGCN